MKIIIYFYRTHKIFIFKTIFFNFLGIKKGYYIKKGKNPKKNPLLCIKNGYSTFQAFHKKKCPMEFHMWNPLFSNNLNEDYSKIVSVQLFFDLRLTY